MKTMEGKITMEGKKKSKKVMDKNWRKGKGKGNLKIENWRKCKGSLKIKD